MRQLGIEGACIVRAHVFEAYPQHIPEEPFWCHGLLVDELDRHLNVGELVLS